MQTATPMAQKVETTFSFKEVQWVHVTKHGILCLHCMALSRNGLIPDEAVLRILHVCAQRQQKVVHDDQLVELDKHRRAACMRLYGVECIPLTVQQEFNDNIRDVISLEQDPTVRLRIPGFYPPIHACDTNVGAKFSHQARSECTQADLDAVPDAPTFYPSEAEFADPAKYLTLVSALAKQFGICKIVPPDSWHRRKGASKVSREWNIKTCIQPIHELMHRDEKKNNTFGYEESEMCTVRKFEEAANVYQQLFLQQHYSSKCSGSGTMPESPSSPHSPRSRVAQNFGEQLAFYEKKYWDIVSGAPSSLWPTQPQPMYTLYANDMDSNTVYDVNLEYGGPRPRSDPWNLNTLSQSNRMLLSFIARFCTDVNLSGVAQPWIYFGMLFSTFCWHTEDNYLFSINCLHEGSSKFWYGVPGWGPQQPELAFERAFYSVHSQKAKHDHANILYDLRTMISPAQLREHNVPVYRLVQHAGEIVVTLPHAYHSGFSTGFNCAEAVNFALPCWFVYGVRSETRYKKWRKEPVFSTQLLMYLAFRANGDAALRDMMISKTELTYIQDQFACVIENERVQRAECRKLGLVSRSEHLIQDDAVNRVCMHCQQPCDFSAVRIVLPISDDSDSGASSSRVGKSTTTSRASYLCLEHALRFRDFEGEGELAEYVTLQELESVLVRMRTYVADARPPLTVGARTFSHNGVLGVTPKSDRVCLACVSSAAGTDVRGKITDPPWESSFGVQELLREVLERP
ncbi:Lysine-specific demethylase [Porphyridium purpureum]|uniref:Lysine-specific demethylase n=1 Tax=Porphyridium purpureum TaxID=35688 RepID=A0A5J4YLA1_PORPP|nr:Lysine-specific demethylase [Porphyridium purpureum]|eukprot:POR2537..scf261_15